MNTILDSLTDVGLRRLFKFVLKRAIGKYLKDELLLEQLEVKSRDGIVKVKELYLDCEMLNSEYFASLPFELVSVTINALEATLSYATLLSEGCRFQVSDVVIELQPKSQLKSSAPSSRGKGGTVASNIKDTRALSNRKDDHDPQKAGPEVNSPEEKTSSDGLKFIANWIEVMVASLQLDVNNFIVRFLTPDEQVCTPSSKHRDERKSTGSHCDAGKQTVRSRYIELKLAKARLHNTHPDLVDMDTSVSMTSKVITGEGSRRGAKADDLGSTKYAEFSGLTITIVYPDSHDCDAPTPASLSSSEAAPNCVVVLTADDKVIFQIKNTVTSSFSDLEADLTIPDLRCALHSRSLAGLLHLAATYTAATPSTADSSEPAFGAVTQEGIPRAALSTLNDNTLRTLLWLEEESSKDKINGPRDGGEIDYGRVVSLIKQYHTARTSFESSKAPVVSEADFASDLSSSQMLHSSNNLHKSTQFVPPGEKPGENIALGQDTDVCDVISEGDEDFPSSEHSESEIESDENDDKYEDEDSEDVDDSDSGAFLDTRGGSRRSVVKLKMGSQSQNLQSKLSQRSSNWKNTGHKKVKVPDAMAQSTYGKSAATVGSAMFFSAMGGNAEAASEDCVESRVFFRLHLQKAQVYFSDEHSTTSPVYACEEQDQLGNSSSRDTDSCYKDKDYFSFESPHVDRRRLVLDVEDTVLTVSKHSRLQFSKTPNTMPEESNNISMTFVVSKVMLSEQTDEKETEKSSVPTEVGNEVIVEGDEVAGDVLKDANDDTVAQVGKVVHTRKIISFYAAPASRNIIASPHVDISIDVHDDFKKKPVGSEGGKASDPSPTSGISLSITVNLEPTVASVHLGSITHWSDIVNSVLQTVAPAENESTISIEMFVPSLEIYMHESPQTPSLTWQHLGEALSFDKDSSRWQKMKQKSRISSLLSEHMSQSRGGLSFNVQELRIANKMARLKDSLSSLTESMCLASAAANVMEASNFQIKIFMRDFTREAKDAKDTRDMRSGGLGAPRSRYRYYETLVLSAYSDDANQAVILQRYQCSSKETPTSTSDEDDIEGSPFMSRTVGLTPPSTKGGTLLLITAVTVEVDVDQREYNAFMGLVGCLTAPSKSKKLAHTPTVSAKPTTVASLGKETDDTGSKNAKRANKEFDPVESSDSPSPKASPGFGVVLTSKVAMFRFSHNLQYLSGAASANEFQEYLQSVHKKAAEEQQSPLSSDSYTDHTDAKKISISTADVTLELFCKSPELYFAARAGDLSFFEFTSSQYEQLRRAGDIAGELSKQFSSKGCRKDSSNYRIPFLHRSTLYTGLMGLDCEGENDFDDVHIVSAEDFDTLSDNGAQKSGRFQRVRTIGPQGFTKGHSIGGQRTTIGTPEHHAFAVQMLMTTEPASTPNTPPTELMSVHVDFQDITLRYDPQSAWMMTFLEIITPCSAKKILERRGRLQEKLKAERNEFDAGRPTYAMNGDHTEGVTAGSQEDKETYQTTEDAGENDVPSSQPSQPIIPNMPFAISTISVRIRQCVVDYCCPKRNSRLLLTVGLLTMNSTIVSGSPSFSLKFSMTDLNFLLSNKLSRFEETEDEGVFEQSPLNVDGMRITNLTPIEATRIEMVRGEGTSHFRGGQVDYDTFVDAHKFVQLAAIDQFDNLVTLQTKSSSASHGSHVMVPNHAHMRKQEHVIINSDAMPDCGVGIKATIGQCCIFACMDSLSVFIDSANACVADVNKMMGTKALKFVDDDKPKHQEDVHSVSALEGVCSDDAEDSAGITCGAEQGYPSERRPSDFTAGPRVSRGDKEFKMPHRMLPIPVDISKPKKSSWMDSISDDTFSPYTASAAAGISHGDKMIAEGIHGKKVGKGDQAFGRTYTGVQLHSALIEDFYHKPPSELESASFAGSEEPECIAKWLPRYDYDIESTNYESGTDYGFDDGSVTWETDAYSEASMEPTQAQYEGQYELYDVNEFAFAGSLESEEDYDNDAFEPAPDSCDGGDPALSQSGRSDMQARKGAQHNTGNGDGDDMTSASQSQYSDDQEDDGNSELMSQSRSGMQSMQSVRSMQSGVDSQPSDGLVNSKRAKFAPDFDFGDDDDDDLSADDDADPGHMNTSLFGLTALSAMMLGNGKKPAPKDIELDTYKEENVNAVPELSDLPEFVTTYSDQLAMSATYTTAYPTRVGCAVIEDRVSGEVVMRDPMAESFDQMPPLTEMSPELSPEISEMGDGDGAVCADARAASVTNNKESSPNDSRLGYKHTERVPVSTATATATATATVGTSADSADMLDRSSPASTKSPQKLHVSSTSLASQIYLESMSPSISPTNRMLLQAGLENPGTASGGFADNREDVSVIAEAPDFQAGKANLSYDSHPFDVSEDVLKNSMLHDDLERAWDVDQQLPSHAVGMSSQSKTPSYHGSCSSSLPDSPSESQSGVSQITALTPQALESLHHRESHRDQRKGRQKRYLGSAEEVVQVEQQAKWFIDPEQIEVKPHYVPLLYHSGEIEEPLPTAEAQLRPGMYLEVSGSFRIRIFSGCDWPEDFPSLIELKSKAAAITTDAGSELARDDCPPGAPAQPHELGDGVGNGQTRRGKLTRNSNEILKSLTETSTAGPKNKKSELFEKKRKVTFAMRDGHKDDPGAVGDAAAQPKRGHDNMLDISGKGVIIKVRVYGTEKDLTMPAVSTPGSDGAKEPTVSANVDVHNDGLHQEKGALVMHDPETAEDICGANARDSGSDVNDDSERRQESHSRELQGSHKNAEPLPEQRISVSIYDLVVSFARENHRRRKVVGLLKSHIYPRDASKAMLSLSLAGYRTSHASAAMAKDLEQRIDVRLLPLRLFLDEHFLAFVKLLAYECKVIEEAKLVTSSSAKQSKKRNADSEDDQASYEDPRGPSASAGTYIQHIFISPIKIKIDYQPSMVNIQALQHGDYMQLLNVFPLCGMELVLMQLSFTGLTGFGKACDLAVEAWVNDIYAHQIHKVISGTVPFQSLSNIGAGVQDLLLIPLQDNRRGHANKLYIRGNGRKQNVMRELQRGTKKLLYTVTKETLNVSHKLTKYVARGISDLATDPTLPDPARQMHLKRHGGRQVSAQMQSRNRRIGDDWDRQPTGVRDGLNRAYESISREVGDAADAVVAQPLKDYKQTGTAGGYIRSVFKNVPVAVLKPAAGVAEAVSYTLLGIRNNVDPASRREEEDIWDIGHDSMPDLRAPGHRQAKQVAKQAAKQAAKPSAKHASKRNMQFGSDGGSVSAHRDGRDSTDRRR